MSHVFISYSTRNSDYARKLADKLRAEGFDVWIDNSQLRSSEDWWRSIVLAIRGCSAVVVILTPESDASEWVQREITLAGKYKKPIFPLWLDGTLDTPNWEYFVRIQVEDVRSKKLPSTHLYDTLALHAPHREQPGVNVTEQPAITLPEVTDKELEQDIANPPQITPILPKSPQVRNRRNTRILAGAAVVLIAAFVIVLAAVNQPRSTLGTSTPITANSQWTPVTQTFDGVDMVLVPKGCFDMGNDPAAYYWNGSAYVQGVPNGGKQCFDQPFWIDRTEVTNSQYKSSGRFTGDTLPRESINWSDAKGFCESRGSRLPTEAEWEYAARGPSNWAYPWGNDFVADNVVYHDNSNSQTVPVGSKPGGISWVGALDVNGNVWEWVSTIYDQDQFPYPYAADDGREDLNRSDIYRGVRGGSWDSPQDFVRAAVRDWGGPTFQSSGVVGFRCARDYETSLSLPDYLNGNPITVNSQWMPVTQTFDGLDMVLVPKGCFEMGNDPVAFYFDGNTYVQGVGDGGKQCFDTPFWIGRTEVTNAQYGSSGTFSGDTLPRESLNWSDAKAFCERHGARLPSEAEWEYAARGPSDWFYPWGNDFVADNVVYAPNDNNRTAPVGSKPGGVSWVGALDMSGNVGEWISTIYDQDHFPYPYKPDDGREDVIKQDVLRGVRDDSWNLVGKTMRAAFRRGSNPTYKSVIIGFRCVRDYS